MRVVIAAWHLRDSNVGIGRYCRALLDGIERIDCTHRYDVVMPVVTQPRTSTSHVRYRVVRIPVFRRRVWEQIAPNLVGPYDLVHVPYDSCLGWTRGKQVVTIHDVKPLVCHELAPRSTFTRWMEARWVGDRRRRIDHVITDSEQSRSDIVRYLGIPQDRLTVVYPGVDVAAFLPAPVSRTSARPFVLTVAGTDPTKNVPVLVRAFRRLPAAVREAHDLVLAGDVRRSRDVQAAVEREGLAHQTRYPGVVSDEDLIELYRQASLFVFPSRYEGFGLPVLEAMACGCPVISSSAASLPEVVGGAGILVPPDDEVEFARHMERVLQDPDLQRGLRERGLQQAATFSWDRTAQQTIAVYEKVMS